MRKMRKALKLTVWVQVTLTISGLFEMGAGAAQSGVALNICRFFSGFFASGEQ